LSARLRDPRRLALAGVILLALVLRVWGAKWGLPFGYQTDEERVYVPDSVRMLARRTLDPDYLQNPPLFSYLLSIMFGVLHGGKDAVDIIKGIPQRSQLFLEARILTALIGTLGVGLVFVAARRLFGALAGLLAALIMAVAFLPVSYSHAALNNVPAMVAATGALIGIAGILRYGRTRDYVIAGAALGVAAATKYTAGIVLVPLLSAVVLAPLPPDFPPGRQGILRALCFSLGAALLAFLVCNPLAIFSNDHFRDALQTQGSVVGEEKYGLEPGGGVLYYLWSFTWGLGWIPVLAALGAIVPLWRRDRRIALVLVPVLPLFILYMGTQTRYYARWMLPLMPIVCILAGYGGAKVVEAVRRWRPALTPALPALIAALLAAQGLFYSVHVDRVLSRPDTLNVARTWMIENIPPSAGVIIEPNRARPWDWVWPRAHVALSYSGDPGSFIGYLDAGVVRRYLARGFCWVQTSSNYWGPALRDTGQAPRAPSYWRALERHGDVVYSASPWGPIGSRHDPGEDEVEFNYDYAYDFYPLAYDRPGPAVLIYRLHGGRCGAPRSTL